MRGSVFKRENKFADRTVVNNVRDNIIEELDMEMRMKE
jgi:hypothetical protein